jgi:poly(3-hydroxyoctanoate) depolymerase
VTAERALDGPAAIGARVRHHRPLAVNGPANVQTANPIAIEMVRVGDQLLRVGRTTGGGGRLPLLVFNGIGGNIELLAPFTARMREREVITFDVPGVGHSQLPRRPYRLRWIVRLACGVLDHYGHDRCDVLGVSWGGAAAQVFALAEPARCRRLVLCATAAGWLMWPARPSVAWKMATPRRFRSSEYARRVAGEIYGGDFRRNPDLAVMLHEHIRWQTRVGYYFQILAVSAWTSAHWLRRVRQPTLIMAGADDPLVPLPNARLLRRLIPNSELKVLDCGHLFLFTRAEESARAIREFLDRA